jgi:hypothetical protein
MLSSQEEQEDRRRTMQNDVRVREERRRMFADQSVPNLGTTFQQFAQSDADIDRGRFTTHERSTVIGSSPTSVYPPGPAWCADPGAQCVEPPLGLDNPALESSTLSPVEESAPALEAPSPDALPKVTDDVELRAGARLSRTYRRF